tara:strand:- start:1193 stop:1429 length:237 start_codon:yes stop_codon:yes gene_type:complete
LETLCFLKYVGIGAQSRRDVVWSVMEEWLEIPSDRKSLPTGRLCLILALAILLVLAAQGRKLQGAWHDPMRTGDSQRL